MSIDANKTVDASRPDLAALEVNAPIGYIGFKIYPMFRVSQKAGTVYPITLVADAAAQTNRSAGAAPTAVTLAENADAFSAAERIKRYKVPWEAVPCMGGVEGSDKIGGMAAKRSVVNSVETAQIAELIDAAGTDISGALIDGLLAAADSVHRYAGATALVMSFGQYRHLIQQTEIKNLLTRTFTGLTAQQVLAVTPDIFAAALASMFAFTGGVHIYDEDFVPAAYATTGAVVKVPNSNDPASFLMQPELGRTIVYWPSELTTPYEVSSYPDKDVRSNIYDACVWDDIEEYNADAKYLVNFGGNSATTTTTTTTTTTAG